ncbi:Transferase [Trema orientale]|uniref:Transferase n=1 Tax=Trema orientale TaxID=63057 RepID=A0A2P5FHW2_TREOI|nr:Transferase [Trema orientale]
MPSSPSDLIQLVSTCTVFPDQKSTLGDLKLSVSDLPMLSCHYIQKGGLFTRPPLPIDSLLALLRRGLSRALSRFPPLAGRLTTDPEGHVFLTCNDAGADFVHANAGHLFVRDVLGPAHVPDCVKGFFALDRTVSYSGHFGPILAVQVTELADGVFIGCAVNHAVTDGTSFWNFFNTFAEVCRGVKRITRPRPDFSRDSALISTAVLKLPEGGPKVTFSGDTPLRERIFSFSREAVLRLKDRTNKNDEENDVVRSQLSAVEFLGKLSNDTVYGQNDNKVASILENWLKTSVLKPSQQTRQGEQPAAKTTVEISSFQSLSALLWRAVTRARKLPSSKKTTFRMAVNCRHRLEPKLDPYYFGNAIQSVPTYASAGDVLSRDLRWCAEQLNSSVRAHDSEMVRRFVEDWESEPRCFPLGNADGASITMGSSPRFPMYDNDFGWGRPLAVRSGRANKFDGKISAFPGRDGTGTVDLEVVLSPETMAALESDSEFMQYVSS